MKPNITLNESDLKILIDAVSHAIANHDDGCRIGLHFDRERADDLLMGLCGSFEHKNRGQALKAELSLAAEPVAV